MTMSLVPFGCAPHPLMWGLAHTIVLSVQFPRSHFRFLGVTGIFSFAIVEIMLKKNDDVTSPFQLCAASRDVGTSPYHCAFCVRSPFSWYHYGFSWLLPLSKSSLRQMAMSLFLFDCEPHPVMWVPVSSYCCGFCAGSPSSVFLPRSYALTSFTVCRSPCCRLAPKQRASESSTV